MVLVSILRTNQNAMNSVQSERSMDLVFNFFQHNCFIYFSQIRTSLNIYPAMPNAQEQMTCYGFGKLIRLYFYSLI